MKCLGTKKIFVAEIHHHHLTITVHKQPKTIYSESDIHYIGSLK